MGSPRQDAGMVAEDPVPVHSQRGLAVSSRGVGGEISGAIISGGQDVTLWVLVGTQTFLPFPLLMAEFL